MALAYAFQLYIFQDCMLDPGFLGQLNGAIAFFSGLSSINFVYPSLHPISHHAGLPSSCIQQRALEGEMPSSSQRVCAEQGSGIQLRQRRLLLDFLTVHLESADA